MNSQEKLERHFQSTREELGIRTAFPADVMEAARAASAADGWKTDPARHDREALPFVSIDPAGSRDLDQALYIERSSNGFRVFYAIADVAAFVERGGVIEEEAWKRWLTYYSPDRRDPLYPPDISQGAGSLLPEELRPAILFEIDVDLQGEVVRFRVTRARIRSRAQLTYPQALEHITGGLLFAEQPFAESLSLLREVGERRVAVERARGGVSLPIIDQHVAQSTRKRLGYQLVYEDPNIAEEWNAQISLLTGHVSAERMLAAGVGLLRTAPPALADEVAGLRRVARALGFSWPGTQSYPDFIHSLDLAHPRLPILVWQARRLMKGADYVAFSAEAPEHRLHSALAMTYSHSTAPLRRLADRYVLDLLVQMERGGKPNDAEIATLQALPAVMDAAERRAGQLERKAVDIAEASELARCPGTELDAVVLEVRSGWAEVQIAEPPVRARVSLGEGSKKPELGATVRARVVSADPASGKVDLELVR